MKLDKLRRRKNKTDYRTRLELLKSGMPRIVVRKTNKYIILQYIKSNEAVDKVVYGTSSKDLLKLGWSNESSGSLKSIPACYLTGYYLGKKITEKEKNVNVIFDIGLARNISGSRLYASLKGLVDSGLKIKHSEAVFPDKDRIEGKHLSKNVQKNFEEVKSKLK
ncbi:MAG TPA: 50S ribosomal protein L18 [Candidatus Nanoarchaeia archaeon]|nr:50S ribosomal protein L18 [Candidatus Nanoarchaeia archaeon]